MLRFKHLKIAGMLLIAVFLLVSISAPGFAKVGGKYDKYTPKQAQQNSGKDSEVPVPIKAGVAILAIFVVGKLVMGRKSDGTVVKLGQTDSKTLRTDISKNSGR